MVCELERLLRECDDFLQHISDIFCTAVAMVAQMSYFVSAFYFDR